MHESRWRRWHWRGYGYTSMTIAQAEYPRNFMTSRRSFTLKALIVEGVH
jgi:hypothetical protein